MTSSRQPEHLRLFVAVTLPAEARDAIARLIQGLRAADLTGVRLVDPDGVHLTLKFLGNVDSSRVPALTDALDAVGEDAAPFALHLRGVGVFPDRRSPRVLWAGVSGDTDALAALARRVDDTCATVGFPRERRPYSPHLTLARLRDRASEDERQRAGSVLAHIGLAPGKSFAVEALHLIKSTLTPSGPIYDTVHTVTLNRVA